MSGASDSGIDVYEKEPPVGTDYRITIIHHGKNAIA